MVDLITRVVEAVSVAKAFGFITAPAWVQDFWLRLLIGESVMYVIFSIFTLPVWGTRLSILKSTFITAGKLGLDAGCVQ
jgi:hypothetical protein